MQSPEHFSQLRSLKGAKVYIIDTKIPADRLGNLRELAEKQGQLQKRAFLLERPQLTHRSGAHIVDSVRKSDVVVTQLTSAARIAKHLDGAHNTPVVSIDWLQKRCAGDLVQPVCFSTDHDSSRTVRKLRVLLTCRHSLFTVPQILRTSHHQQRPRHRRKE